MGAVKRLLPAAAEPPAAAAAAATLKLLVFIFVNFFAVSPAASSSHSLLDPQTEATLLTRVETKHSLFPTFLYGKSKTGNPVFYKPKLGGLRDYRKLFVLQTDSYIIDLWLQETGAPFFTLVLDFAALSHRLRAPSFEMWESLRTVADPLPAAARAAIGRLVSGVFNRCEAVVVINATSLLKLLKPVIGLMVPVGGDRLFVSTDASALLKVVAPEQIPRPYSSSSSSSSSSSGGEGEDVGYNPLSLKIYDLLNERARAVLGRPLAVVLAPNNAFTAADAAADAAAAAAAAAEKRRSGRGSHPAGDASASSTDSGTPGEDDDSFDDID